MSDEHAQPVVIGGKPRVRVRSGPETIRVLEEALNRRVITETYVTDGRLKFVERVSGSAVSVAGDEDSPLPVVATTVTSDLLARLLANHTYTHRMRTRKTDSGEPEQYEEECTPDRTTLSAALASKHWPGLPPLYGIVGSPVLRPDGTLLQERGYDEKTGLYLALKVPLPPVPERPTP